jgi:lipoprotein-anchoring transpeptidase ErfK/SrfK
MNLSIPAAYEAIKAARQAQLRGDKLAARRYAEEAARLAPELEESWLMLAAVASPRASVAYLERALSINPGSERAQKGMAWATRRLRESQSPATAPLPPAAASSVENAAPAQVRQVPLAPTVPPEWKPVTGAIATRRISPAIILLLLLCAVLGITALSGILTPVTSAPSAGGSWQDIARLVSFGASAAGTEAPTATPQGNVLAINQPTYTPVPTETPSPTATPTPSATPTETPSPTVTNTLLPPPTMVVYLPTEVEAPPAISVSTNGGERWIDVDLTNQMVYAYEGNSMVNSFVVSTGTWQYPTVTGQYNVWIKLRYARMTGPGYDLPNVPYVMYFYKGYGLHGTYWHSNFGTPMSHGCVNLSIPDAEWLYNFASEGTLVNVHY